MHLYLSNNMITHFTSKLLNFPLDVFLGFDLENKYKSLIALAL